MNTCIFIYHFLFWQMKIYCCVFTTKMHDLSLFFMPLYRAKRDIGYFDNFKADHQHHDLCYQIQQAELHHLSQQNSNNHHWYKSCAFFFLPLLISWTPTHILLVEFGHLAWIPAFTSTIPLHGKWLQKGWPSGLCPKRLSWPIMPLLILWWLWSFLAVQRPWCLFILLVPQTWVEERSSSERSRSSQEPLSICVFKLSECEYETSITLVMIVYFVYYTKFLSTTYIKGIITRKYIYFHFWD